MLLKATIEFKWTNTRTNSVSISTFFHKRALLRSTVFAFLSLPLLKDWMELRRAPRPTPLALGAVRDGGLESNPGGGGGGAGGAAGGGRGGAGGAPALFRGNRLHFKKHTLFTNL